MRHLKKGRKFHRESAQRKALMKALATALIINGKIKTTHAKAKELRPMIERFVTRAKVKTPHTIRLVRATLAERITKKLFDEIATRYQDRAGGYTRIIKLGQRKSDASHMARIEFI